MAPIFAWLDGSCFWWLHGSYGLHVVDFYFYFFYFIFLFLPLFYFMHEETGWHFFGIRITRILEKGKWRIFFLVGERKISFWKKNRDRIKEKMGGF